MSTSEKDSAVYDDARKWLAANYTRIPADSRWIETEDSTDYAVSNVELNLDVMSAEVVRHINADTSDLVYHALVMRAVIDHLDDLGWVLQRGQFANFELAETSDTELAETSDTEPAATSDTELAATSDTTH